MSEIARQILKWTKLVVRGCITLTVPFLLVPFLGNLVGLANILQCTQQLQIPLWVILGQNILAWTDEIIEKMAL